MSEQEGGKTPYEKISEYSQEALDNAKKQVEEAANGLIDDASKTISDGAKSIELHLEPEEVKKVGSDTASYVAEKASSLYKPVYEAVHEETLNQINYAMKPYSVMVPKSATIGALIENLQQAEKAVDFENTQAKQSAASRNQKFDDKKSRMVTNATISKLDKTQADELRIFFEKSGVPSNSYLFSETNNQTEKAEFTLKFDFSDGAVQKKLRDGIMRYADDRVKELEGFPAAKVIEETVKTSPNYIIAKSAYNWMFPKEPIAMSFNDKTVEESLKITKENEKKNKPETPPAKVEEAVVKGPEPTILAEPTLEVKILRAYNEQKSRIYSGDDDYVDSVNLTNVSQQQINTLQKAFGDTVNITQTDNSVNIAVNNQKQDSQKTFNAMIEGLRKNQSLDGLIAAANAPVITNNNTASPTISSTNSQTATATDATQTTANQPAAATTETVPTPAPVQPPAASPATPTASVASVESAPVTPSSVAPAPAPLAPAAPSVAATPAPAEVVSSMPPVPATSTRSQPPVSSLAEAAKKADLTRAKKEFVDALHASFKKGGNEKLEHGAYVTAVNNLIKASGVDVNGDAKFNKDERAKFKEIVDAALNENKSPLNFEEAKTEWNKFKKNVEKQNSTQTVVGSLFNFAPIISNVGNTTTINSNNNNTSTVTNNTQTNTLNNNQTVAVNSSQFASNNSANNITVTDSMKNALRAIDFGKSSSTGVTMSGADGHIGKAEISQYLGGVLDNVTHSAQDYQRITNNQKELRNALGFEQGHQVTADELKVRVEAVNAELQKEKKTTITVENGNYNQLAKSLNHVAVQTPEGAVEVAGTRREAVYNSAPLQSLPIPAGLSQDIALQATNSARNAINIEGGTMIIQNGDGNIVHGAPATQIQGTSIQQTKR